MKDPFKIERICTCPNQTLLSPGQTCEVCMGTTVEDLSLEELIPVETYDEAYFEALEAYLGEIPEAA